MRLIEALGLGRIESEDFGDSAVEMIVAGAKQFLEAGGMVSLTEWGILTATERHALQMAGRAIRRESEVTIAASVLNPDAQAAVLSSIDGGRAVARQQLVNAMDAIEGTAR